MLLLRFALLLCVISVVFATTTVVSLGTVSNCGIAGNGVQLCSVTFTVSGDLTGQIYPSVFYDENGVSYSPAFLSSSLTMTPAYSVGGVYEYNGHYSGAQYNYGINCSITNTTGVLNGYPSTAGLGNYVYGVFPQCQNVGNGYGNPAYNNTYYATVNVTTTGSVFNVYQNTELVQSSFYNVSWVLSGISGNDFIDVETCTGAPFQFCQPGFNPSEFPSFPHLFQNSTGGEYHVLTQAIYTDVRYNTHFFGQDWTTHFAYNAGPVSQTMINYNDFCSKWDGKCLATTFQETFRPVLVLDGTPTLASQYPGYAVVDGTAYGYPGNMVLVANSTANGRLTITVRDHLKMNLPVITLETYAIDCSANLTTVDGLNSGEAGIVLFTFSELAGSNTLVQQFIEANGVFSIDFPSRSLREVCVASGCLTIASAKYCHEIGAGLVGAGDLIPQQSSTPVQGVTTTDHTILYVSVGLGGFCFLAIVAAIIACVVIRRRRAKGYSNDIPLMGMKSTRTASSGNPF